MLFLLTPQQHLPLSLSLFLLSLFSLPLSLPSVLPFQATEWLVRAMGTRQASGSSVSVQTACSQGQERQGKGSFRSGIRRSGTHSRTHRSHSATSQLAREPSAQQSPHKRPRLHIEPVFIVSSSTFTSKQPHLVEAVVHFSNFGPVNTAFSSVNTSPSPPSSPSLPLFSSSSSSSPSSPHHYHHHPLLLLHFLPLIICPCDPPLARPATGVRERESVTPLSPSGRFLPVFLLKSCYQS